MTDWTAPHIPQALATFVAKLKDDYAISQEALADLCHLHKDTLSNILTGKTTPSNTTRKRLFTGIAALLNNENNKKYNKKNNKENGLIHSDQKTWLDVLNDFENTLAPKTQTDEPAESTGYVTVTHLKEKLPFLLARNNACNTEARLASLLSLPINEEKRCVTLEIWKVGNDHITAGQIPAKHYLAMQNTYGLLLKKKKRDYDHSGDVLFREGSVEEFKQWLLKTPLQAQKEKIYIESAGQVNTGDIENQTNYITIPEK